MSVATMVSEEEYLSTSLEHDADWVDGEVVERSMPMWNHSRIQGRLIRLTPDPLIQLAELRVRLPHRFRVIDFCVYAQSPGEGVPGVPPLVAAEILSPDDKLSDVVDKLQEYVDWGVPHVWLVDPDHRHMYRFSDGLRAVDALEVPEHGIRITASALFG
jgi:Uma2 family endonuclease